MSRVMIVLEIGLNERDFRVFELNYLFWLDVRGKGDWRRQSMGNDLFMGIKSIGNKKVGIQELFTTVF